MVKDLELLKEITPLFEKKLILCGVGESGESILEDLEAMGAGKKGILLCDYKQKQWDREKYGIKYMIVPLEELGEKSTEFDSNKSIFLIMEDAIPAQDEMIEKIERQYGRLTDIYTEYAVKWGIYLNIANPNVRDAFRKEKRMEKDRKRRLRNEISMQIPNALRYFSFIPLHNDEIILVYQPGKVASSSIYRSILNFGRYVLHCHTLADTGFGNNNLYKLLSIKSGKIISLVREPVARQISAMWQNIPSVNRYSLDVDFFEIERYYLGGGGENAEFEWFDWEMKEVFGIDVFAYPFDAEKGYTLIKEGNIELLLMKMEKLSELENVIGEFLGIEQFKIENRNVLGEKPYRFAMKAYKERFSLTEERLSEIYFKNEKVRHFYSETERKAFYDKWKRNEGV